MLRSLLVNTIMEGSSKNPRSVCNKTPAYQINATFLQCIGEDDKLLVAWPFRMFMPEYHTSLHLDILQEK
jgi:hypothetical protein